MRKLGFVLIVTGLMPVIPAIWLVTASAWCLPGAPEYRSAWLILELFISFCQVITGLTLLDLSSSSEQSKETPRRPDPKP